jgi:Tfp pilus assembly protein PilV
MRPQGAVLVVVLICLGLAAGLFAVVVNHVAAERKALQAGITRLQAAWLAEAALERAAARLAVDPKYAGETWTIPAAELSGDDAGVVRIHVDTVADKPERRLVRVEADYPDVPERRCRQVKQIVVDRDAIQPPQPSKTT